MTGKQHTESFVIQFRTGSEAPAGPIEGRLEHVASGRATHFRSLEELLAVLKQWLADLRAASGQTEMPAALVERMGSEESLE